MANAIAQTLLAKRTHKVAGRDKSRVIQFKNDQILVTAPREIERWKHIGKGTLLRWPDGGENRIIVEVLSE
jgi:hypothetical protein